MLKHAGGVLESAAFPRLVRWLAIAMILALAICGAMASDELRRAAWSSGSLWLFTAAWLSIAWLGYWIVHSRTRLVGDTLVQTWLWTKRSEVQDVAQLKLVHWAWVDGIVAPRLLVRQRSGAVLWFNAADARILRAFCDQVAGRSAT